MAINSTQILFDRTTTANAEYIGFAGAGVATSSAQWKIMKIEKDNDGNPISIKYAGGVDTAINEWDDRATLVYS